jgi:hypothetical protein
MFATLHQLRSNDAILRRLDEKIAPREKWVALATAWRDEWRQAQQQQSQQAEPDPRIAYALRRLDGDLMLGADWRFAGLLAERFVTAYMAEGPLSDLDGEMQRVVSYGSLDACVADLADLRAQRDDHRSRRDHALTQAQALLAAEVSV